MMLFRRWKNILLEKRETEGGLKYLDTLMIKKYKKVHTSMLQSHADQILKMSFSHRREIDQLKEQFRKEASEMLPKSVHDVRISLPQRVVTTLTESKS